MNILPVVLIGGLFLSSPSAAPQSVTSLRPKIVTASQVNGTWVAKFGTFKVWALNQQKLRVEFSGIYPYKWADGTSLANTGEGGGIAVIEGDTATFRPDEAESACVIMMRFAGGGLVVKQEGDCGFGHKVTAAGKYRKANGRRPKFKDR